MANLSIPATEIDARLNTVINNVTSNLTITSVNVGTYRNSTIYFSNTSDSTITIEDDVFTTNDRLCIKFYNATNNGQTLTVSQEGTGGAFDGDTTKKIFIGGSLVLKYVGSNAWIVELRECPNCTESFVQISADAVQAPGTDAADLVPIGISSAREFLSNKDNFIMVNIALPVTMDKSVAPSVRLGWATPATTGNVVWSLEYIYYSIDDDVSTTTPDGTVKVVDTTSTTANGYEFTSFDLATPSDTDRIIAIRLTRPALTDSDDTCSGTVYAAGLLYAYNTKY